MHPRILCPSRFHRQRQTGTGKNAGGHGKVGISCPGFLHSRQLIKRPRKAGELVARARLRRHLQLPAGIWTAIHQMTLNGKQDGFTMEDFRACANGGRYETRAGRDHCRGSGGGRKTLAGVHRRSERGRIVARPDHCCAPFVVSVEIGFRIPAACSWNLREPASAVGLLIPQSSGGFSTRWARASRRSGSNGQELPVFRSAG